MPEISNAESDGSDVDGILTGDTDIDQLSATSISVIKGKNMYSFQLFFLFSCYPYILMVLIVPTKGSYCPLTLYTKLCD